MNEKLFVLVWTDNRSRLRSGETEPGIKYYDGRSGIPCWLLDAKQYKTRQGAERACQNSYLPLKVVEFELVEVEPANS